MQKMRFYLWGLLALLLFSVLPGTALAQDGLRITDVTPPEEGTPAAEAKFSIYFSYRQKDEAVINITKDNCSVNFEGSTPEVKHAEVREFIAGDRGVGILFVFPNGAAYDEEYFGIRTIISSLLKNLNRPIDMINAVPYDANAAQIGWQKASVSDLSNKLSSMATSNGLEPNLFSAFTPATKALGNLQGVSQKYLVFISDAEGAGVGEYSGANRKISEFAQVLKQNNIIPIVIAYSPDGDAALRYVEHLNHIVSYTGVGLYLKATSKDSFQQYMENNVYNYIFKQYIYDVEFDMDGSSYLDPGKYTMQLVVKMNNQEDKAAYKLSMPALTKSKLWLILLIGGILLVGGVIVGIIIYKRNQVEEEEIVDEGPQEVRCATCGKTIPQQLYGFNGEFCLSGGLPDCPYYQMPDRGKLTITKGALADTTFFIKKDMTTIGSYRENDIFLNDPAVSRKHAAIKADEGMRYEIRDFGSSNGLYINGERTERKFLKDGDIIRFGTIETEFKLK